MYISGASVPEMYKNTVENSSGYGIRTTNHADVQFGVIGERGYNEVISNGSYGIYANNYSDPFLGTTDMYNNQTGGSNSIHSNVDLNLKAISNSHVEAEYNYWGGDTLFNFDVTSSINYTPMLSSEPSSNYLGSSLAKTSIIDDLAGCPEYDFFDPDTNSECALWHWAHDLRISDQLPVALWAWELYVDKFPSSAKAPRALVKIINFTPDGERDDLVPYLKRIMQKNASNAPLRVKALELLVNENAKIGDYPGAIGQARKLLSLALTEDQEKVALFSLVELNKNFMNNPGQAHRYLELLELDYPGDEYSLYAAEILGQEVDWSSLRKIKANEEQGEIIVPAKFNLHSAYPNPFNPVTTLSYDLPSEAQVELAVFDISGRLVTTLVKKSQAGGSYDVQWNGMDANGNTLPSGLYLYRLQAGKFVANEKMLLLK